MYVDSRYIKKYLHALKIYGDFKKYELFGICVLNRRFHDALHIFATKDADISRNSEDEYIFDFDIPKKLEDLAYIVIKRKHRNERIRGYFRLLMSEKEDLKNCIIEFKIMSTLLNIVPNANIYTRLKDNNDDKIRTGIGRDDYGTYIQLRIAPDTSQKELIEYIKDTSFLGKDKKTKKKIGEDIRVAQIYQDVLLSRTEGIYPEQQVAREYKEKYGKSISEDAVKKKVQRLKKLSDSMNNSRGTNR